MNNIIFRIAKPCDARELANIHYHIRDEYKIGFFSKTNKSFLRCYYNIILNDPNEVVICAVNEEGNIVGFNSGSLDVNMQFKLLKKKKWYFVWPLLCSAVANPKIITDALKRYKSIKKTSNPNKYITSEGARGEYWAWMPNCKDGESSVLMHEIWLLFMKTLGAEKIYFEVDSINKKIYKFHKINGAIIDSVFELDDKRERTKFYYDFNTYKFKFI